jgi:hypothetical protein
MNREIIEQGEEHVLGVENHAALEKVEPGIDATIQKAAPLVLVVLCLLVLVIVWYVKSKKKSLNI